MLEPRSMRVLHDALRPPAGKELNQLVITTFTLDLVSLLSVPLALSRFAEAGEDQSDLDPLAALASVQRQSGRITVFHQADKIAVPSRHRGLLPLVEDMLVPVRAPRQGAVFHPKLWIARYADVESGKPHFRVLCLSRNLTGDRCWDTILSLDGTPTRRARQECKPLSDFVAWAARERRLSRQRTTELRALARQLASVHFAPPSGFERVAFCPIGIRGYRQDPIREARRDRVLMVSPFIGSDQVANICAGAREAILVTRPEEVGRLAGTRPSNLSSVFRLDDGLEAEPDDESTAAWLAGLHAKLYVADQGWNATVWTGSANATSAAFGGNVEFLVQLTGKKSACGIEAILGSGDQSFRSMLLEADTETAAPEDDPVEEALDEIARRVAELPLQVEASQDQDVWTLTLAGSSENLPTGATVTVIPLVADRPAQELTRSKAIRITFPSLKASEVSGLFEVMIRLEGVAGAEYRFVAYWPLIGAVPDRVQALLVELANDPDKLLAFLRMFLTGGDALPRPTQPGAAGNGSGGWASGVADTPLLELFLRTLAREPDRLDDVAKWLPDLASALQTGTGAELLRIWEAVWEARQELDG